MTAPKEEEQESLSQKIADRTGIDVAAIRKEVQDAYAAGDISGLRTKYPFLIPTRAAAAEGGMMASAPGPKDDYDDIARELFGKGYKELTPEELEMFQEELERLMNKFRAAKGGIASMAEGGMMDLGGNEMDLRGGGFVPIGKKEKADDVPARLSKNEFVFTADAVRAAGGGSVDRGADLMYKTMKQLENKVA